MKTLFNYKIYAKDETAPDWLSAHEGTIDIEKTQILEFILLCQKQNTTVFMVRY